MASAYVHKSSDRMLCRRHATNEKSSPLHMYILIATQQKQKMCPLNLRATSQ